MEIDLYRRCALKEMVLGLSVGNVLVLDSSRFGDVGLISGVGGVGFWGGLAWM
jgi:hypothetical protein